MKYVVVPFVLLVLVGIQASVISFARGLGLAPSLIILFLVSWSVIRGSKDSVWAIAVGGLLLGLFTPGPTGLTLLALLPIVPLAALRELRLLESNFLLAIPVLIVGSLLYFGIMLIGLSFSGEPVGLSNALRHTVVPGVLGNLVLFAPTYGLIDALARPPRDASAVWGNSWRS